MVHYFGKEMLDNLYHYYGKRAQRAEEQGLSEESSQYYWLFEELCLRMQKLQQAKLFLDALPRFMITASEDDAIEYVTAYLCMIFSGQESQYEDDEHPCFNLQNVYWADLKTIIEKCGVGYDMKILPLLYIDLCEIIVCGIRLYFNVREERVRRIDGSKFDGIMSTPKCLSSA